MLQQMLKFNWSAMWLNVFIKHTISRNLPGSSTRGKRLEEDPRSEATATLVNESLREFSQALELKFSTSLNF